MHSVHITRNLSHPRLLCRTTTIWRCGRSQIQRMSAKGWPAPHYAENQQHVAETHGRVQYRGTWLYHLCKSSPSNACLPANHLAPQPRHIFQPQKGEKRRILQPYNRENVRKIFQRERQHQPANTLTTAAHTWGSACLWRHLFRGLAGLLPTRMSACVRCGTRQCHIQSEQVFAKV